jgi:drug/metabolite transporter (DMT)-like permease
MRSTMADNSREIHTEVRHQGVARSALRMLAIAGAGLCILAGFSFCLTVALGVTLESSPPLPAAFQGIMLIVLGLTIIQAVHQGHAQRRMIPVWVATAINVAILAYVIWSG